MCCGTPCICHLSRLPSGPACDLARLKKPQTWPDVRVWCNAATPRWGAGGRVHIQLLILEDDDMVAATHKWRLRDDGH
jgi:hypothetical protein